MPVASRIDDCSLRQAVWLAPDAVRRLPVDGADAGPLSWAELMAGGRGASPFEPITSWGSPAGASDRWSWSPQWEAAAGHALAHLLVASEGSPVTVPDGPAAEVFRRVLDGLLPEGPPARRAVLAGPGLPAPDADAAILLVPVHPQTGEVWAPAGQTAPAYPVPLPFGVWFRLVLPEPRLPVPASALVPDGVLRDDPPIPSVHDSFRVDPGVFRRTLVRLPAVRSPWLREILEDPARRAYGVCFRPGPRKAPRPGPAPSPGAPAARSAEAEDPAGGSGGGGVGPDGEDPVETDDGQDAQGVGGDAGQDDVGPGRLGVLAGGEECGDAAGVAELQAGQVDDQALARSQGEAFDLLAQGGGMGVVEVADDFHHGSGGGVSAGDRQRAHRR
ncbi:hypothetical protein GCM10010249_30330 [Streptomyces roseolilacinus]|uniref:Uncharacterized protein n=1 Tax=Streptomyces roseolilacinus TaxID=66904 RepID=A0A918B129_9ACTN|nr:hypothetical protein GCM10010249_30330 [Streptomyces roseolilacinus]